MNKEQFKGRWIDEPGNNRDHALSKIFVPE